MGFSDAIARYSALGLPFWSACCEVTRLATLPLSGAERNEGARRAREIFERVGATRYVERLEEILGRTVAGSTGERRTAGAAVPSVASGAAESRG